MYDRRCLLPTLLFLTACPEPEPLPADAGTSGDAGVRADAGGDPDAGAVDTGVDPDVFEWPVPTGPIEITPSESWKNRITLPDEPFRHWNLNAADVGWVKFSVLMRDPSKVYFQNSTEYPFHYEFVTDRLDPFQGMSRAELDRVSLFEQDQEVILGAVLIPPDPSVNEYAVQLVRQDAYHPEMVRIVFELVRASVDAPEGVQAFYFPTFEQRPSAELFADWLAARDVTVGSVSRWLDGDQCYSTGWAIGTLKQVPAEQIDAAYTAGELRPEDILLTDAVPAEIPFLAGVLTTSPSTPNSHVAILARSYGVPFGHLVGDAARDRATALVGQKVALRVRAGYVACTIDLFGVDLDPSLESDILALKQPSPLAFPQKTPYGAYSASVDGLTEADARFFGGKAANFGLLREVIPESSPEAIAFSFDLWDRFMGQTIGSGQTLAAEIDARLSQHTWPPDFGAVTTDLKAVRDMIEDDTVFEDLLVQEIDAALARFDDTRRIRFRSSTNVEDGETFTGAGLYESHSGCKADDQDADELGPSLCNASKAKERGVFRAIRKVYASFYEDNAFLERLRRGVDESAVGMAILVHYSFPDEQELANGVATVQRPDVGTQLTLVTQKGAVSVANPDSTAEPEVADVYVSTQDVYTTITQRSSLVPLGGTVLELPGDYDVLSRLLVDVAERYKVVHPELDRFVLDFEYKKVEPAELVVKQVRRIPLPGLEPSVPAYLLDVPVRRCTSQGEYGTALANHRTKMRAALSTEDLRLDAERLATTFFREASLEFVDGDARVELTGAPSAWTGAEHAYDGERVTDTFATSDGARSFVIEIREMVRPLDTPLTTLADYAILVSASYDEPVATFDWNGLTTTTEENAWLGVCPEDVEITPAHIPVEDRVEGPNGIVIETGYWWPPPPGGIVAGYTAPLVKWERTTITGLTSEPIELTDWFAQTYRPGHHNFSQAYVFDPWLEPDLPASVRDELSAANVRLLYVGHQDDFWILGLDGVLRPL